MRLDLYLSKNGYFSTRTKALQAIERGEVYVNGKNATKSSFNIAEDVEYAIEIKSRISFVSLGGFKLEKALNDFSYNVSNLVIADLGASTGGFTDCLIKRNAKLVYAVDLNDTLLDNALKGNDKVVQIIKNVKDLTSSDFDTELDLITADLSFISSSVYMPIISSIINDGKDIILLIKPQFEIGEKKNFKNGIIKDKKLLKTICRKVYDTAILNNLYPQKLTTAPIKDNKNTEFLILLTKNAKSVVNFDDLYGTLWKYWYAIIKKNKKVNIA